MFLLYCLGFCLSKCVCKGVRACVRVGGFGSFFLFWWWWKGGGGEGRGGVPCVGVSGIFLPPAVFSFVVIFLFIFSSS